MSRISSARSGVTSIMRLLYLIGFVIVTTISTWITAFKMKRGIRRALGSEASEGQLTSIATWMKVDEAEERKLGGKIQ